MSYIGPAQGREGPFGELKTHFGEEVAEFVPAGLGLGLTVRYSAVGLGFTHLDISPEPSLSRILHVSSMSTSDSGWG